MTATAVPYTLEKFASGRFDVRAENGQRIGSILGGGSGSSATWCAEIGNRVLGYFPSRPKAAESILADRGIKGLFQQMQEIVEGPNGLLERYMDDFYIIDRATVEKWRCATDLLWFVRRDGTGLVELDCAFSQRTGEAYLDAFNPKLTGSAWRLFHLNSATLRAEEIDEGKARDMVRRTPRFEVKNGFITQYGKVLASIEIAQVRGTDFTPRCNVILHCDDAPEERLIPVLTRHASHAIQVQERSLFSTPNMIEIHHGKKCVYRWRAGK